MKFAAANWWFALRPAFFQIFSVFVMRVLIMGLSFCYDVGNRGGRQSAAACRNGTIMLEAVSENCIRVPKTM